MTVDSERASAEDALVTSRPLDQAYGVLASAVGMLSRGDRPPTASEVRLEMKRLTYGGFSPKAFGFKRFRDFLDGAEAAGYVAVDKDREGDVAVVLPRELPGSQGINAPPVRSDLWKAFVDWSPRLARYF